tara:strand:- start:10 stop:471 length:462 start_codon:yes stop_codon:yes gene_type:complete
MKKLGLVLIALLVFTTINAQKMWKNEVDDFTGKTIKVTNYYNVAKTNVGLIKASVQRVNNTFYLQLKSTSDIGCAGASDNYVMFIFTDGTKLKLKDKADINCKDDSSSLFLLSENSPLFTKAISKIRLRHSEFYTDGETSGTYTLAQILGVTK